jgi:hypothetical protein
LELESPKMRLADGEDIKREGLRRCEPRNTENSGNASTKVTSVCQRLARVVSASMLRTASVPATDGTVGCGTSRPKSLAKA